MILIVINLKSEGFIENKYFLNQIKNLNQSEILKSFIPLVYFFTLQNQKIINEVFQLLLTMKFFFNGLELDDYLSNYKQRLVFLSWFTYFRYLSLKNLCLTLKQSQLKRQNLLNLKYYLLIILFQPFNFKFLGFPKQLILYLDHFRADPLKIRVFF